MAGAMGRMAAGTLAGIAALTGIAFASPWNRSDGRFFVASRLDHFQSDTDVSRYRRIDTDLYLEFGVTSKWMTGGKAVYGISFVDNASGSFSRSGLTEGEAFLQRQILRGDHSATALKIAGVYDGDAAAGARVGASAGGVSVDVRALHGRDLVLRPFKMFLAAEGGYRRRFEGSADQLRAELLVGLEPTRSLLFMLETQTTRSLRNEEAGLDDFDVTKAQATLVWRATRRWAVLGGARQEFAARNIEPGSAFFLGLWTEF